MYSPRYPVSADREIYYKESSSKKYSPLAYFLAKVAIELLNAAFSTLLFGLATYWINGYDHAFDKFLKFSTPASTQSSRCW